MLKKLFGVILKPYKQVDKSLGTIYYFYEYVPFVRDKPNCFVIFLKYFVLACKQITAKLEHFVLSPIRLRGLRIVPQKKKSCNTCGSSVIVVPSHIPNYINYNDHQAKNSLQRKKIIEKKILGKEKVVRKKIPWNSIFFFFGKFCIQNGHYFMGFLFQKISSSVLW